MESPKAWETTVGHEIGHVLKGTEAYGALRSSLFKYAESKGELATRREALTKMYDGLNADIDEELTSDLIGDYLFNDKNFIKHLTNDRNVFQKIWDEVKYLYKVATGKEKTSIEKVMKEFDRAWKEMGKGAKGSADIKYHISEEFSNDIDMALEGKMEESSQVKARDYTPEILVDNGVNDLPMLITQKHLKSIIYSEAEASALGLKTGKKNHYHGLGKDMLIKAVDSMDNPLEIYKQADDRYLIITEVKNSNGDNVIVPVKIYGKGTYNDVYIDENQILSVYGRKNLENYLSKNDFVRIYKKGTALNPEVQFPDISSSSKVERVETIDTTSTENSIAPITENVNAKFSLSEDSEGNQLSKDIENFDNSWYNEVKLPSAEQERVQSEALTWNAYKRNQLITQTLSNGITYRYMIDDDGIVHIYERETSVNIHERKKEYDNTDGKRLDSVAKELWIRQGNNSERINIGKDGRKPSKDDTNDNYFVSREGRSNRTGHSKDWTNANRKPKEWHFNEDGSVEVTYSDGTKETENTASIGTSSTDDVFFDAKKYSLSNKGEQPSTVGTPLKDLYLEREAPTREDVALLFPWFKFLADK